MDKQKRRALVLTAMVLGGSMWFLSLVSGILLPFVVGLVLAYLLNPLVLRIEKTGLPRPLASAVPVSAAVSLLVIGLVLGVPLLIEQLQSFAQRLPVYVMALKHFVLPAKLAKSIHLQLTMEALLKPLGIIGSQGAEWTVQALQKTISGVAWLVNLLLLVVMTPLVAFYLLVDWPGLEDKIMKQMPKRWRTNVKEIWREIDVKLAAYLRGTVAVCFSMAVFYAVSLTLLHIPAGWLSGGRVAPLELGWAIGLVTGMLTFLPIIGATVGVVMMLAVALVQYQLLMWEPYALIGGLFLLGQALEGYVLAPLLVGGRVGLHPLWVIFALLAGGTLGGIMGMLLALPVAVVVSVVLPRVLTSWREAVD